MQISVTPGQPNELFSKINAKLKCKDFRNIRNKSHGFHFTLLMRLDIFIFLNIFMYFVIFLSLLILFQGASHFYLLVLCFANIFTCIPSLPFEFCLWC